jgi:alpha-L-arabinofuranosidase
VWTLAGPSLDAVNSFADKECISPKETTVEWAPGGLVHTFDPYSVTILRFG